MDLSQYYCDNVVAALCGSLDVIAIIHSHTHCNFVHFFPFNIYIKSTTRRLHRFLIINIFHEVLLYVLVKFLVKLTSVIASCHTVMIWFGISEHLMFIFLLTDKKEKQSRPVR